MATTPASSPGPRPPQYLRVDLTGEVEQIGGLRHACKHLLESSFPVALVGDVLLVVSELVSNVHRHTPRRTGQLLIVVEDDAVRVAVSDLSTLPPVLVRDAPVGGRGVRIVDAIADTWGVTSEPSGKTVWASIRTGHAPR